MIYASCDMFLVKKVLVEDRDKAASHLGSMIPQNLLFGGVNRHFQAILVKYQHLHIIESAESITTKFCTVTDATKYSSWMVQTCS